VEIPVTRVQQKLTPRRAGSACWSTPNSRFPSPPAPRSPFPAPHPPPPLQSICIVHKNVASNYFERSKALFPSQNGHLHVQWMSEKSVHIRSIFPLC